MNHQTRHRSVFGGEICGFGTTSGHRVVIGRWPDSPLGSFADVMMEAPDGARTLLAPSEAVATFIRSTYTFDHVRICDVEAIRSTSELTVRTPSLMAEISIGSRTAVGAALRLVPARIARSPWWCSAIDPVARIVMRGVRTKGTAGNGRSEWYGATDARHVTAVRCSLDGDDLGRLADVWPPVRFGFGSTPRAPAIVTVTTTVDVPEMSRTV